MDNPSAFPALEHALSADRFGTYLAWAGNDRARAVGLYTLNTQLSESLYTPLHALEVTLRNRIDQVMGSAFGQSWFELAAFQLNARQPAMIAKARDDLAEGRKDHAPSRMVAALTFAFWTTMLGKEYENLWQTTLHAIARRADGKGLRRKDLAGPLTSIRILRNRIAHHEPVLHWNLRKHYGAMLEITGWLAPPAADWCRAHARFESVYPAEGITLVRP